MLKSAPPELD